MLFKYQGCDCDDKGFLKNGTDRSPCVKLRDGRMDIITMISFDRYIFELLVYWIQSNWIHLIIDRFKLLDIIINVFWWRQIVLSLFSKFFILPQIVTVPNKKICYSWNICCIINTTMKTVETYQNIKFKTIHEPHTCEVFLQIQGLNAQAFVLTSF